MNKTVMRTRWMIPNMTLSRVYKIAYSFLVERVPAENANAIVDSYLELKDSSSEPVHLKEIFRRILGSAQNSNMKAGVIGESIDGFDNLGKALFSFNHKKTLAQFKGNPDSLLDHIVATLKPRGKIRRERRSIWPKYCKTILSVAEFLTQFKNGNEFYDWANSMYKNKHSMPALPLVLAAEIEGIGYPLACDFLKELGFVGYGKPDVHVIEIFVGIGICPEKPSPYQVQKVISNIAAAAGVSSYNVDKLFWLIGSGKFYNHKNIGKRGHIGRMKKEFIEAAIA
ncbi:hypothetical protein Q2E61_14330 [Microbulbifer thermotolerans]|uniref:hypothetical protein n=1 Tax=Microbulbifer thermotolerans TaxID=252514 RepID=UPI002673FF22|nr:hypothetical protein [Microbulbifer thermotolerans]WKT60071.1 hypothetical protein Q2E61_14330 [Microbulbifer thermotolerans]